MEKDILARMGFMTQSDKSDFENRFALLVDKTEKLERDVSALNSGISRLEKKLDELLSGVVDSRTVMNDVSAIVSETKNNLRIYNQSERQLLNDIQTKIFQQLNSQFDEIHYLQYNLQKISQSVEDSTTLEKETFANIQSKMDSQLGEIKTIDETLIYSVETLLKHLDSDKLTKDDLCVIESFLRFIAANQMIQETYFDS